MDDEDLLRDAVSRISHAIGSVANALVPQGAVPGKDAAGGRVASVTEAVMGMTAGLFAIASALDRVAQAMEDKSP